MVTEKRNNNRQLPRNERSGMRWWVSDTSRINDRAGDLTAGSDGRGCRGAQPKLEEESKKALHSLLGLFKTAFREWRDDNCARLGAALSFYSVFSLAPLVLIAISFAGLVLGRDAARNGIVEEIRRLVGSDAARSVETMVDAPARPATNSVALAVGIVVLLLFYSP